MADAPAGRRRNPRGQGQVLRAQLVDAAAHLLATVDQPETLTLRRVAREVGVAPASIYGHFPDLGALVDHVLRQRYAELAQSMDDAARDADDPLAELVFRCAAYARWGVEQPGYYRTLLGGRMPAGVTPGSAGEAGAELLASLVDSLDAATAPHARRATPQERWQAGLLLWTALHGLVSVHGEHGDLPWPPLDDLLAELIGLHAATSAARISEILRQRAA